MSEKQTWQVRIDIEGQAPVFKTFRCKAYAEAWAARHESRTLVPPPPRPMPRVRKPVTADVQNIRATTLGTLLTKYAQEVSALKRGASSERYRIGRMLETTLCKTTLAKLTSKAIADYRNERLQVVGRSTVRNELSLIRRSIEVARREWGVPISENVAALVTLPRPGEARDRRLEPGEFERLEAALADNQLVWAFVRFAIETGMRRSEIIGLKWRHVDTRKRLAYIRHTKTGSPRTVPLTDGALDVLRGLETEGEDLFPINESTLRYAWDKAGRAAGIRDLHFHDLRHEAVSRFFEMGLGVPDVAMMSGHKTPSMLFRYTNLRPYELATKLRGMRWKPEATLDDVADQKAQLAKMRLK